MKKYIQPDLTVISFFYEDVITASPDSSNDKAEDDFFGDV